MVWFQICGYLYIYLLESVKISKLFNMQLVESFLTQRSLGILVHPSSIPGGSYCGTFGEGLKKWIDLLSINKIRYWQFLPLTPVDQTGSPYSSPSSFAINPWFLDVNELINSGFISENQEISEIASEGAKYDFFDFKIADTLSALIEKNILDNWTNQSEIIRNKFFDWSKNNSWVDDYALFMVLKEEFDNKAWWEWPEAYRLKEKESVRKFINSRGREILGKKLFQWHLNRQWIKIKKFASEKGIKLIGDLPFYVSNDSVDVWSNKSLFSVSKEGKLIFQSGVPPDYFSETGQLWGNPVYRWSRHKASKYRWWRKRISRHLEQVDFLRLDHFRALEAFWAIPGKDKTAENGFWLPSPGKEILRLIKKDCNGFLPLVAEDLGLITSKVEKLRDDYELAGMKILQFAFDGNLDNPYLPENIKDENWIVYTGTHDNSTSQGWWKEMDQDRKEQIRERILDYENFTSWELIRIGMETKAKLFVAPMQDLLNLDDSCRLNKPGTTENNWSWRLPRNDLNIRDSLKKYGDLAKANKR